MASLQERIGDFVKTNISADTKVYTGNNLTIWVKGDIIQQVDADSRKTDNTLNLVTRWVYSQLSNDDKEGTTTAIELVEKWINDEKFKPQTIETDSGGGDVTVIDNNTDFSTETTLSAILAKIISDPSTSSNQVIANNILNTWNSQGVPLRNIQGNAFCLSTGDAEVLSNIPNAQDRCAYLFRAKSGSGGATIKSFFFSFESINSDEYEIRVSIQPEFQNWTPSNGNFSNVSDPANPLQSKLEFAQAGELGMPDNGDIQIIGYNQALGGRLIFGKRALGFETVDSRPNFELFIPEGLTFALSVLATDQGASVKSTVSWNE
jgi:hypothetical protein